MTNVRKWLDKGTISAARMPALLPLLIRQARLETPVTYGAVAKELGLHHRAIEHIAALVGFTLSAIGKDPDWDFPPPPPLHALIINDITRLPGSGIDGFLKKIYRNARSDDAKRAILKAVYADCADYAHWLDICHLLDIPFEEGAMAGAINAARNSKGRGGEGPDHLRLKNHVASHPEIVGLAVGSSHGKCEQPTAAGDRIDIVFDRRTVRLAVEVKPYHATEGDVVRGVFQCLKYREVLKAETMIADELREIGVVLVLGGLATSKVIQIANRLAIRYIDGVADH